jgi:hypothetical protein
MFVGHYAAALAAKAAEPRAPLWAYVAGCQLLDIGWSGLVMAGMEKVRVDPSLPGSPLVLYHMPYTHGLPAALGWSVVAGLVAKPVLRLPWSAAAMVGATVFSHWLADLLVHRPDLELFPHGPMAGLGFWNYPIAEMALEMGLVAIAGAAWTASRKSQGRTAWPAVVFLAALTAVQILSSLLGGSGGSDNPIATGAVALSVYLTLALIAAWVDAGRPRTA